METGTGRGIKDSGDGEMDGKQGIQEVNRNKELLPKKINQKEKNPHKNQIMENSELRKPGQKRRADEKI